MVQIRFENTGVDQTFTGNLKVGRNRATHRQEIQKKDLNKLIISKVFYCIHEKERNALMSFHLKDI